MLLSLDQYDVRIVLHSLHIAKSTLEEIQGGCDESYLSTMDELISRISRQSHEEVNKDAD